jgi:uncharacterized protein YndB with AHSA1/START domain
MYGTVRQLENGRWQLRFVRTLRHPPAKVWRAITEPDHLAQWMPTTIEGERAAGAALRFTFPGGQAPSMEGEMLAFEPESVMELRWGPDVLRMELCPVSGGTEFRLFHLFDERGRAARDAAGWHVCLDALQAALAGTADSREHMAAWGELHPHYVESFGPEAATIGPPEQSG